MTSGRLYSQTATLDGGATGGVLDQRYQYDALGNLTLRQDAHPAANTSESFGYDTLNRVTGYTITGGQISGARSTQVLYDARGNITYKSDVGRYWYDTLRPNRLTGITLDAPSGALQNTGTRQLTYAYDDDAAVSSQKMSPNPDMMYIPGRQPTSTYKVGKGNLLYTVSCDSTNSRHSVRWEEYTSFNMLRHINFQNISGTDCNPSTKPPAVANRTLTFDYGPEHQRIRQDIKGAGVSFAGTTWYFNGEDSLGLSYEVEKLDKTNTTGGNITHKHYFSAGGMVFASYDLKGVSSTTGYTCPAGQTLSGSECLQTTQTAATTGGLSCPVGSMADGAGLSQTPPECYKTQGTLWYVGQKGYHSCPAGFSYDWSDGRCKRGTFQPMGTTGVCPAGWSKVYDPSWGCVLPTETVMNGVYEVYTCPYGGKTAPLLHAYDVRYICFTQTVAPVASYTCPAGQTLSGTTCTGTTRTAATPGSNFSTFTIQTQRVLYFHHDHLGSVIALSDQNGAVVERMAFDAWGKRRNINGLADPLDQIQGVYQDRGYTMHENILMFR